MNEPFSDLPDALVRDLLMAAMPLAEEVSNNFGRLLTLRKDLRRMAQERALVRRKADLEVTREPSVVGIDGSYQIHRLTSIDLCAAAAVAVEGTAKETIRHWEEPYHRFWPGTVPHDEITTGLLRGLMISMELELAHIAPHDLVLLDGSFASLIIFLNQGLSNVSEDHSLSEELLKRWESDGILQRLTEMLASVSTIAMPKYTSRNELRDELSNSDTSECDGRTLATLILEPGEYTRPLSIYNDDPPYRLPRSICSEQSLAEMNNALTEVKVVYFRPYGWVPALRLEVPGPIAHSSTRLSLALEGIQSQFWFHLLVVYPRVTMLGGNG